MYDVMQGVLVVEVSEHTFMPAAGMALADWGANVIKIERTTGGGDPMRSLNIPNLEAGGFNPYFEAGNRGKRSVTLDLLQQAGRDVLYKLIAKADVFITNLRKNARVQMGIEPEELFAQNPRLIYARGTGNGLRGPLAPQGGFDGATTWYRGGLAYLQSKPGKEPPGPGTSYGDLMGGLTMAGAISAALFKRERTGKGSIVDNSLYSVGAYLSSQHVAMASLGNPRVPTETPRSESFDPLVMTYRTRDDRWINLCLLMPKWWPDFCAHIDRGDLTDDPRFTDPKARYINRGALIAELDETFARHTMQEWAAKLEPMQGVWAPAFSPLEISQDPQALVNGFVAPVGDPGSPDYMMAVTPLQFDEQPVGQLRRGPKYNEHTDEVLGEFGFDESERQKLREAGVLL
jgi:crotonobetainyl-CoA:carnitine CoA-transferase CaiB-like acyl-CoA transferase